MNRRILAIAAALILGTGLAPAQGQVAATYPTKVIRIVVPAAPGGSSDILARLIGRSLQEKWKQPVVIENRPGADSNVGAEIVAKAPPDGHTLLVIDISTLTMSPLLYPKLAYNPGKDFAPITMLAFAPYILAVNSALPVQSIKELVAYSKAKPGTLNFASPTNATRLAAAQLSMTTGVELLNVPYRGAGAALIAISGGESNISFVSLLATLPHLKGDRIRALAVGSRERMDAAPTIPTMIESGLPDFVVGSYQGMLAPAGTPDDIVKKLSAAVIETLNGQELKAKLSADGAIVMAEGPDQFAATLREDTAKWAEIVKKAGIKPEP